MGAELGGHQEKLPDSCREEKGAPARCPRGFPGGSSFLEKGRQCLALSLPVSIDDLCNLGSRSLFGEADVLSYPHLSFL